MAGMDGRDRKAALAAEMKEWNAEAGAWAMGKVAAAAAQAGACAGGEIPCPPKVNRPRRERIRLLRNVLNNNRQRELLMKGGGILGGIGGGRGSRHAVGHAPAEERAPGWLMTLRDCIRSQHGGQ